MAVQVVSDLYRRLEQLEGAVRTSGDEGWVARNIIYLACWLYWLLMTGTGVCVTL